MATTSISFVFESKLPKVKEELCIILNHMKNLFPYISESDLYELRLVYSELLINAIVHGNKEDSSKKVKLTIEVAQDEILSIIEDEGDGFDYQETLEQENNPEDFWSEHGRGLQLVSSLTEYLNFNNSGNEIEFHKKITMKRSA